MHCFVLKNILKFTAIISLVGKCDNNHRNYLKFSDNQSDSNKFEQGISDFLASESMNNNENRLKPDLR